MKNQSKATNRRRILGFFMALVMFLSSFSSFATVVGAQAITTGASGTISDQGIKYGLAGGIDYITDSVAFRVGISRDPGHYNGGDWKDKQDIYYSWEYRFPENDESFIFIPNGKWRNSYELGKYDPGSRNILKYNDAGSKSRVIHLESKPSSTPTNPVKTAFQTKGYSFTGAKTYASLKGGKWKTEVGNSISPAEANAIWSYILAYNGVGGGWDIETRIADVVSPHAYKYTSKKSDLTKDQKEDIARGYTSLLIATWRLAPEGYLKAKWENAIEDYLTGSLQGKGQQPSSIVVDTATVIKWNAHETRLIIPTLDYFHYYTAVGAKWDLYGTTNAMVQASRGDTYQLLSKIVTGDLQDSPKIFRTSTKFNKDNVFSWGAAAIVYPYKRFNTTGGKANWKNNEVATGIMDSLYAGKASVIGVGTPGSVLYGFLSTNFAMKDLVRDVNKLDITFEATPDDKWLSAEQELIGEQVTLTFESPFKEERLNQWTKLFEGNKDINKTIKIKITPNRTASPAAVTPPQYTSALGNFTTGVDLPQRTFLDFIRGKQPLVILDNVASEPIGENGSKVYTYKPKMEITYNDGTEMKTVTVDLQDTASFKRPQNPPEYIGYTSTYETYSEFKHNSPDKEEFEAMAGVPSNKRLYLGVGGNEFIVDVELEYKEKVDSVWRTYRSFYTPVDSEFRAGDTAPNQMLGGYSVNLHDGGTYTKTWTGSIPNKGVAKTTNGSGNVSATSVAIPDRTAYNAALKEAEAYVKEVNSTVLSHTSVSDRMTRAHKGWGASITTNSPVDPTNNTQTKSCFHSETKTDKDGKTTTIQVPDPCTVTATPNPAGSYTITVTFNVPMRIVDGPDSEYILPLVEDNWKQRINFDYMRISRVEVYKIEEGRIVKVDNVFGDGNSELKATIKKGNPTMFHNIAQQNAGGNDKESQSSKHGRIRYTLEWDKHDVVEWAEGVRTNKSAGMGANGVQVAPDSGGTKAVQDGGHNNFWAKGILYNNPVQTTEVDFHRDRGGVSTSISNRADSLDTQTVEWKKFDERRKSLNKATIISDMLILQTSSGDQSVMYFARDSEEVQSQEQFPDVRATKQEMWDDNPLSAANWTEEQINGGSYNGHYKETGTSEATNKKYWGYNYSSNTFMNNSPTGEGKIDTRFDNNGAGVNAARKRPAHPSKLYIYETKAIEVTTQNNAYVTGDAETFYTRILSWRTPTPYEGRGGVQLRDERYKAENQKNFANKLGLVDDSPYSEFHNKVNNIIIHTPVSVQDAMIISLPKYRDQRTETPAGGAGALIDEQNKLQVEKENEGFLNIFTPAIEKLITTTTKLTTTKKSVVSKTVEGTGGKGAKGSKDFVYTGSVQTFTAPDTGTYTLEVWGASGKNAGLALGGKGGYSKGEITLNAGETVSVYVGGQDRWNGGGAYSTYGGGNGGDATDIRKGGTSLSNRIIVAGGGGGAGTLSSAAGGAGGGLTGVNGKGRYSDALGGTQTAGGTSQGGSGRLGFGGAAEVYGGAGGGGGGYYGGAGGSTDYPAHSDNDDDGGGGGSGYIGGVKSGTMSTGLWTGVGKAKITYDIPAKPTSESSTDETVEVSAPSTSTSTSKTKSGDPDGYRGYTWEQLFGANWKDYIVVKQTTTTDKTASTTDVSYKPDEEITLYEQKYWDFKNTLDGFTSGTTILSTTANDLKATIRNKNGYFYSPNNLSVNDLDKDKDIIEIRLKNNSSGKSGQVYFTTNTSTTFNNAKMLSFPISANDTGYKTYRIKAKGNTNWVGILKQLRFNLANDTNTGDVLVDYIAIYTSKEAVKITQPIGKTYDFSYKGSVQTFTAPDAGTYELEVWGAQGGSYTGGNGGKGGYSKGSVTLSKGETINLYVGGTTTNSNGGWNGGGTTSGVAKGGGGATDVRKGGTSLSNRIIVAGGGGGAQAGAGGDGGGLVGGEGTKPCCGTVGQGGTQTAGGTGGGGTGTLGKGGNGGTGSDNYYGGAGGGGYYGGGGANTDHSVIDDGGGGGGSGYIGGVQNGTMTTGAWTGNGKAKITFKSATGGITSTGGTLGTPTSFPYTGRIQTFVVPTTGTYQLETWGAQGGHSQYDARVQGGKGGYSAGVISLTAGEVLNIYVGGHGGYNGGGAGNSTGSNGGGATDVRKGGASLSNRIIVAGGGGGCEYQGSPGNDGYLNSGPFPQYCGAYGGGLNGMAGIGDYLHANGAGATQTSGHALGLGGNSVGGHSGAGGGGYYGGFPGGADNGAGGGGSGYIGGVLEGRTIAGNLSIPSPNGGTQVGQSGNGFAKITPLIVQSSTKVTFKYVITLSTLSEVTVLEESTIVSVDEAKVKRDLALFPDRMPDGSWNPVKLGFGVGQPKPDSIIDIPVGTVNGGLLNLATFINVDYPFRVYYPNVGDFAQQPTLAGIGEITTVRGKGYVNNMDTTQYTESKRIRFQFNVIYRDVLYPSDTWIELPVEQEFFDFYAVLANRETMGSEINYEAVAINGRPVGNPVNDNLEAVTNKNRFENYFSYHGAYKRSFVDVVGRIGNFTVTDTEDFRFSNLFKQPICGDNCKPEDWVIDGLVKKVHINKQFKYYGDVVDIRGEKVSDTGHNLNTYGTQTWLEKAPITLPINPKDNEHPSLKEQFLKPGYDIFSDISTIGDYAEGVVRVLPYYFKLDIQTGEVTPLDVYQKSGTTYEIVNKYRAADGGTVPDSIKKHGIVIDWENEAERRNYTLDEHTISREVAETYGEYTMGLVLTPENDFEEGITGIKPMLTPEGNFVNLGNAQRIVSDVSARTFIGKSETYGLDRNPGNVLPDHEYSHQAQRWHLKFGLPASSVFVESGKEVTNESIEAIQKGTGVVLMAADIVSVGGVYSLRWEQPGVTSITVEKDGVRRIFDIRASGLPPVIALYDLETTAVIDVDIKGSH